MQINYKDWGYITVYSPAEMKRVKAGKDEDKPDSKFYSQMLETITTYPGKWEDNLLRFLEFIFVSLKQHYDFRRGHTLLIERALLPKNLDDAAIPYFLKCTVEILSLLGWGVECCESAGAYHLVIAAYDIMTSSEVESAIEVTVNSKAAKAISILMDRAVENQARFLCFDLGLGEAQTPATLTPLVVFRIQELLGETWIFEREGMYGYTLRPATTSS